MDTILDFISKCNEKGIDFKINNEELLIEAKKGLLTNDIIFNLKQNKQEIISLLKKKYAKLSFAQERLWFIDQYEHNASYNIPGAVKLIGKLDINVLEKTFSEIIRRHEVLRTNIVTINNVACQLTHKESKFELKIVDQSHLPEEEANQKIKGLIEIESQKPFDLANDSLIRLVLYKISDEEHTLFLNQHHIISDGWSLSVFLKEISVLYKAFSENKPSPLPELEIQYADYAVWQRKYFEGEVLAQQSEYWKNKLSGTAILELPTDKTRPGKQTFKGANLYFSLDKGISYRLNAFSKENDATLFMTLLSAFNVLLNRYTGQDDICVGSPIANRTRSELEPLIGFFVNTLALRSDLSGGISFVELVKQVKQTTLDAYGNQDIPFEKVVDIVQPERNLAYSPLFQVMLVLQNNPASELSFGDLRLSPIGFESNVSKFDLTINFTEAAEGLVGGIEYNTDLFGKDRIERMIGHLHVLVESITSNPTVKISDLEILTPAEKHQLLVEWNDTEADYPKDRCIHQLFEEQVEKTPGNIAVVFENKRLTYRELNEKSNQLAHYLQPRGVEPDSLVGICVERSLEMIVGLLGILKAGGAYVPIDPTYPEDRISYMLEDADCEIVLTQEHLKLPETNSEIIYLDADWGKIENEPAENVKSEAKSDNLAYVIYTSGSTGKPKGVMNQHNGIVNRLFWTQDNFKLQEGDVILQKTTYSFDVSVWELFWPIIIGCKLVFAKPEGHKDNIYLIETIIKEKITTIHFVPSMLYTIIDTEGIENCLSLKRVLCSGEALSYKLTEQFYKKMDNCSLHNLYGPTEAAVDVSYFPCVKYRKYITIPIGKPVTNTKLLILDKNNKIIPIGVPGELHIGGEQVARGYLKRPELTAEKFINNPFSDDPNSKLYKTGDLVKYLPDGNIEFIGRIDNQVKVRGFRIELGEIESVLNKIETIKDCVVVAKDDIAGNKRLVAYIVLGDEINVQDIREALSKSLPDYMVPSLFVSLEKMPLTPNGKIDRKSLPEPEGNIETTNEYVAPRNETEQKLADIWAKILGVEKVGVYDNFFEFGGHSLLATQVISKIRNEFNIELPLKTLFEKPRLVNLSEIIENTKSESEIAKIAVASRNTDPPLSFAQERLWFIDQYEHNANYNMPGAVKLIGKLDINVLEKTFSEIIRRHEVLRTNIVTINNVACQLTHKESKFELKIVDQSHLPEEEANQKIRELIEIESQKPFDLANDSLVRLVLYKISEEEHTLFLNQHHIISDGWSLSVFLKEISVLYKAFSENKPSPLPELEIQYADYAVWQRKYFEGEVLAQQSEYWKNKLSGTAILELPTDKTRPGKQTFKGANLYFSLDKGISYRLNAFSKENDATLFMTLLSAFNVLLNRYTGQDDICVGSPIANRTRSELEPLIGFFVNTLALRSDLSGGIRFVDLVKQVRQTTLDAYGNQDIPFEKVVDVVQPERNLAYSPLFQVMMVLQNNPREELSFGDLRLSPIEFESNVSKFDLIINFTEIAEGLVGGIEYNTDLFNKDRIERMIGHLNVLLESIISNPTVNIAELEILTSSEKHQLLVEWNDTEVDYPKDKCIHQLFEDQVEKTPANIAVVFESKRLTYRELNEKSNQLAHYLQPRGVKPDSLVGICVERSLEMIVGLLGILKAGGAYMPIDPTYPEDRISYMLEDADCEIVLTQEHLKLPETNSEIIYLDADWDKIENEPAENVKSEAKSDNLAYVIYTSGSTGKPKGTEITHRNVNRLVSNTEFNFLRQRNKVLQYAPISFDASIFEIWGTICNGSSLIVCPEGNLSLEELDQIINNSKITVLWLTSGLFSAIVENNIKLLRNIKYLLAGGDVLNINHIEKILKEFENISMINGYGPTEGTTFTTLYFMNKNTIINGSIPIGKPIDNTKTYVLDKEQKLLAVGVPGELYISGDGLAIGYLKRPELTAEKFIKNPYSDDPNSRLYKTGDLVKYLPDGNIEFIGRIDNQVKVRGFRIELGEIESVLNKIETIKDCVVVAKDDIAGNKRLVAYIVLGDEINVQDIREALSKSLPDYMVPSLFVSLEKMPLTPNGKIDKKALPEPEGNIETTNEYVAPRNETEQKLADIWAKILGVEKVGVYDNFFEFGGHSLLATQVISKIRNEFNIELPLKTLFEKPRLVNLSEIIENTKSESEIAKIAVASRDTDPPLSFAQERLWFIDQYEHNASYNMPGAVKLIGKLDVSVLEKTFSEIIRRHEVLRTNIVTINNVASQFIHKEPKFELETIDQSHLSEEEANQKIRGLIEIESQKPFDLANDSLIRLVLYKINDEEHTLFLNQHHIISDGWSLSVFLKEISVLYKAFSENKPSPLPELEIQYADYAVWQRKYFEGEVLAQQSEYWKNKLSGTAILELPTDKTRPGKQTFKGANLYFSLDKGISYRLNAFSKENDATLFMTLLSAFNVLLNRYTGQDDICVGSPIANRTRSELEPLIGFFVNTLALRSDLSGGISFVELVKQVKQTTLDAYGNQDIPFEKVVDIVQPERNLAYSPLFQVMLVLQNNPASELSFGDLRLSPIGFESNVSKFDLTINFTEAAEGLVGGIEYNTDLFGKDRIERMIGHLHVLVESITSNPTVKISDLEILTPAEKHQLLVEWNDTEADYPKDRCIHQLFEEQVEKTPGNIAVVFENKRLTYRELNEKSNQLAHYLQPRGVKPDSLVGICVERSLEMIVGLLGILKAGGAYVPIDPTYPEDRISYMLEDADCEIVLTQEHLKLPETNSEIIYLDADWGKIENEPAENVKSEAKSDNLAYVIYTSGSTGKPKGSLIEHKNVVRLFFNDKFQFCFSDRDIWSLFHSFCFDFSVWEMYGALLYGGKLIIIPNESTKDTLLFFDILEKHKVTVLNQTPSIFYNLLDVVERNKAVLSIRYVIFGGEALTPSKLKFWYDNYPACKLINMYGITETTVHVTYKEITGLEINSNICNIGKPIPTLSTYILDENQKLLPVGVSGELCVSGAGLSRGYLNNEKLTAVKFQKNPFIQGEKIYLSGDLAYVNESGELIYCGRIDHQVKIRGFRIELGEIENTLLQIVGIKQCCVLVKDKKTEIGINKYLVAYYVLNNSDNTFTQTTILDKLSQVLPEYMMPSALVAMESFPLTINGKLDIRALPEPEFILSGKYVAPTTEIETEICIIWQELLGLDKVGITDDFFSLGGNSILSIQVSHRMSKALGCEVRVADVFRLKSIDKILAAQEQYLGLVKPYHFNYSSDLADMLFISPGRAGSEMYQGLAEMLPTKYNCIGIDNYNIHNKKKIGSLNKLASYYLSEYEQKYTIKEPVNLLGWSLGGQIALEMAGILEVRGYKNINVILLDTFIKDEIMQSFNSIQENDEDYIKREKNMLVEKYGPEYVEKIISTLDAEEEISGSSISNYLKHSNVTLFKAQDNSGENIKSSKLSHEHYMSLKSNNIDLVADKVDVIKLDCNHFDILKSSSKKISNFLLSKLV